MPKKTKKGKDRLDKYYHLAKEQGYRSRAAFKLIQLNKKYDFLSKAQVVVDLCAAPGGWMQVVRKYQPMSGVCVGVDLANIKKIPGATSFVGDITTDKTLNRILQEIGGKKSDAVLHDGAPNVGANWSKDAYTQSELVLYSLKIAANVLRPGGMFITKVFRSRDYNATMWVLNQFFNRVEATKPVASRDASAEIYVVGLGYKAPKEIDPKLFDPSYIFEEVEEKKHTLRHLAPSFLNQRRNRNREGYEEGAFILFKNVSVAEFIDSENPVGVLATYNELTFDDAAERYLQHEFTTQEIKILCSDLKVLGLSDFKALLKWRLKMRKFRATFEPEATDGVDQMEDDDMEEGVNADGTTITIGADGSEVTIENKDTELLEAELHQLRSKANRKDKNSDRRQKIKDAKRMPLPSSMTERDDDILDNVEDPTLFSLSSLNDSKSLEAALKHDNAVTTYDEFEAEEDIERGRDTKLPRHIEVDDDEYDELVEDQLESMYQNYLDKRTRKTRKSLAIAKADAKKHKDELYSALQEEGENLQFQATDNPLLVKFEEKENQTKNTKQWFSQNVFEILNDESADPMPHAKKKRRVGDGDDVEAQRDDANDSDDDDDEHRQVNSDSDDDDDDNDSDVSDDEFYANLKKKASRSGDGGVPSSTGDGDLETVPQEMHDEETRATTLAMATKLLRKKERREFIDDAFNRYAFNDDDLPQWFEDDEKMNNRRQLPLTREEIDEQKARFKEVNTRSTKRVLEAKFRKKKQTELKMSRMREKANIIADNSEMGNHEKAKELQKLYKKAQQDSKPKKVYVVARRFKTRGGGPQFNKGTKVVRVDPRMKTERRATVAKESKKRKR